MAVKVMVAPAIVRGELDSPGPRPAGPAAKPRRRRSAIYDADGNEVFITLMCLKCHEMRPLSQFGLRRMADGAIRNQPWCRACRSGAGAGRPRRREAAAAADSSPAVASPPAAPREEPRPVAAGTVAAQVAAALAAGWAK